MAKSNGSVNILSGKQADGDYVEQLSGISRVLTTMFQKGLIVLTTYRPGYISGDSEFGGLYRLQFP